ncbi:MAG: sporulation protein YunB [Bacillota bacterium]
MGRNRRRKRRVALAALGLAMLLVCVMTYAADRVLKPVLITIARNRVQGMGVTMITDVVMDGMAEPLHYSDLIHVETTADGYVSYMMPNTMMISRMVAKVGNEVQERINRIGDEMVGIPMGQLTGIAVLANLGPLLPVEVLPVGSAWVTVEEDFVGVGINHAKHTIFVSVGCVLMVAVPLVEEEIEVSVRVPIAEALIVGPVPEMYLSTGALPFPRQ